MISIVLPTYNRADLLRRCIDSVLRQTHADIEVIIVNDGSADHTEAVLGGYDDPRIRILFQPNGRLPSALNRGHRAARGALLTWISDDCWVTPDWLTILYNGMLEVDSTCGLVFSDYVSHSAASSDGTTIHTSRENLKRFNGIGPSFLYRREVYDTLGGYDEAFLGAEDWEYWLRIATRFRCIHLPGPAHYHYVRDLPDSMSVRLGRQGIRLVNRMIRARYHSLRLVDETS